ncbi:radical SAM/SPASM domain-containing protein [Candidatus Latescibacterota bacterium]
MRSRFPVKLLAKAFRCSPGLIPVLLRGVLRKHIGVERDYRLGTGVARSRPRQISLRITNACNHRCAVCGQYGRHGYMKGGRKRDLLKPLPASTYRELVDQVADYRPIFYVTGGEPFLYPEFVPLMNYIKEKGCILSVVTNGVKLAESAEDMVKNGWDMVLVSFDGPREVHDRCRNYPGAFDTAVEGITRLNEMKRKYRSVKPFVMTSTTISAMNAPVLHETFEIGSRLIPDLMVVYLSWFTSEDIGRKHAELLKRELDVDAFTWESYVASFSREEAELFRDAIVGVKKESWPFKYLIIPSLDDNDIVKYYTEPADLFGYGRCAAPFIMIDVMPNGDVTTCRDFIDVKVGNITEKPLFEIWNDEPFVRFRKLLIDHGGTLPQCSRCCGLMGF